MTEQEFATYLSRYSSTIEAIRSRAHQIHDNVNQRYDSIHPYGYHLDMVADAVMRYCASICTDPTDIIPLIFGAYFHDSIEDARLTYNNVVAEAERFMNHAQAFTAAEIAYALTNEKGRTRAQRADDRYYAGIRATPYAPSVKLADRYANLSYSLRSDNVANRHMSRTYLDEMPHFLHSITMESSDPRLTLSPALLSRIHNLVDKFNPK